MVRICLQCRKHRFDLWVAKNPLEKGIASHSVFLPEEFHGQKSLVGYSPHSHKSLRVLGVSKSND